jgi:prepilin-type processing-associated H-X9-DG protein
LRLPCAAAARLVPPGRQIRKGIVRASNREPLNRRAFSLAELLVVVGVVALLIAVILPPLQLAQRQARRTHCAAKLQQLGYALEHARTDHKYYPLWDDGGAPTRYTWIDVLLQQRLLGNSGGEHVSGNASVTRPGAVGAAFRIGYCPEDGMPDPLNSARHSNLNYPAADGRGIDYSYGIGVPLSAGGWGYRPGFGPPADRRPRRFREYQTNTAGRVLAGDATSSAIYNLNGRGVISRIWNDPTQFDNTIAWQRHGTSNSQPWAANLLFQDGHVGNRRYRPAEREPVNTTLTYLWHPGEPIGVGPDNQWRGNWYPYVPPPNAASNPAGDDLPRELVPRWYTANQRWTRIIHK